MTGNERNLSAAKKTAFCASALAASLLLGYVEALIPFSVGIPGVKLGLGNVMTLLLLWLFGAGWAAAVSLGRVLLSALLFGSVPSLLFSAFGAALSLLIMVLLKKTGIFSPVGVSAAGGVGHNIGQLAAAALTIGGKSGGAVFSFLPLLSLSGLVFGTVIGLITALVIDRIESAGIRTPEI